MTTAATPHLTVPIVDIGPFLDGSDRQGVAAEVARACEDIGFLLITGHRVPTDVTQQLYQQAMRFFDLPTDEKMQLLDRDHGGYGYRPMQNRALAATPDKPAAGDLHDDLGYGPKFANNPYPERPPELKGAVESYFRAVEKLGNDVLHLFALALGLPEDVFDAAYVGARPKLNMVHYPDQATPPLPGQLRAGAHTDFGCLTLLKIDDAPGGLQVHNKQGDWVDVKNVPGAYVLNIGDMLMRWTNDRWISTVHRVVNPPRDQALGSRRLSIVFFYSPNPSTVISCLESCTSPENPPRYEPITAGEYLAQKTAEAAAAASNYVGT